MGSCGHAANRTAETMGGTELTMSVRMRNGNTSHIADVLRVFTEGEKHAIAFALRIAGEQYERSRQACEGIIPASKRNPLTEQFERQKQEILALADALDNGISLALCTCPTCDAGLDDEQALHSVSCSLSRGEN